MNNTLEENIIFITKNSKHVLKINPEYDDYHDWSVLLDLEEIDMNEYNEMFYNLLEKNDFCGDFYKELIKNYENIFSFESSDIWEYGQVIVEKMIDKAGDIYRERYPHHNLNITSRAYTKVYDNVIDTDSDEIVPLGIDYLVEQINFEFNSICT